MENYTLKAVFNPMKVEFTFKWDSRPYTIAPGGLELFPEFLANHAANCLANQMLWDEKKEIDDPKKPELIKEVLSHQWKVVDLTKEELAKPAEIKKDEKEEGDEDSEKEGGKKKEKEGKK